MSVKYVKYRENLQERITMAGVLNLGELAFRVTREQQAAADAKCDESKQAHLALAQQYQRKLALADAVQTSLRISFG